MSNTLYRKYRPQKFSDIIGQHHIVQTLSNAILKNRVSHAYLFTGPRGTGKTTLARIFAKAVNCQKREGFEPCEKCDVCKNIADNRSLDIIEIDAASHTGVDNIRELRETVNLPPTQAKYKVYIIDEVHMLSQGAFNALLKTLEEPPAHVIFILATTEIHKVPETIISRCQRFDFACLSLEQIIQKLAMIAKSEKVKIEKNALEMIAIAAEGGMRDAESILAQVISLEDKNITAQEVEEILGTTDFQNVSKMVEYLLKKETDKALKLVNSLSAEGYDLEIFNKSLLNYLRQLMIISVSPDLAKHFELELTREQMDEMKSQAKSHQTGEILGIVDLFAEIQNRIRSSFIPQLPIEMAIVKAAGALPAAPITPEKNPERIKPIAPAPSKIEEISKKSEPVEKLEEKSKPADMASNISISDVRSRWNELLLEIKPFNHSLAGFLANCQPVKAENDSVTIATKYQFYKEKLNEPTNKLTIEKVLDKILGSRVRVKFVSEEEAGAKIDKKAEKEKKGDNSLLSEAMKILGGKIVE